VRFCTPVLLLATLALPPLVAAGLGARGPLALRLELGPGDGPYLSGFAPFDAASGDAMRWSRAEAEVRLPLTLEGPGAITLRFAPPRGWRGTVHLVLDGRLVDTFECCLRQEFQRRRAELTATTRTPLRVELRVDAPQAPNRGLFLDAVLLEAGASARVRLAGVARARPALLVGVAFLVLLLAGLEARAAAIVTVPLSLALTAALFADPWLTHLLLTGLPEGRVLFGATAILLARALERWGLLNAGTRRRACALALLVFVLRGAAVNHPDYHYPDLVSHARRTAIVRRAGLDAFLQPTKYLDARAADEGGAEGRTAAGLWLYRIGGAHFALPYSLFAYAPVAALARDFDGSIAVLKLAGAFCSALPVILVAALAGALGAPWWSAVLWAAAPTAAAELGFASYPALFGHVFDLVFLLFLVARAPVLARPQFVLAGGLLLAVAMLAYVSSPVITGLLLGWLAVLWWLEGGEARAGARAVVTLIALGAGLALALYYRHFVAGAFDAVGAALASPESSQPARPGPGRIDQSLATWAIPLLLPCALFGLVPLLRRPGPARNVLAATVLGLGVAAGLKLRLPVVFGFLHLALFTTPLVCLAAARGLQGLSERGRVARAVATAMTGLVTVQGVVLQVRIFLDHLSRAR
jgi:hypothetical protein